MTDDQQAQNPEMGASPAPDQQRPAETPIPSGAIFAMPDKFMTGGLHARSSSSSSSGGSGKKMVLIIGIIALFLGGLTAGAYYYINSGADLFGLLGPGKPQGPEQPAVNETPGPSVNVPSNANSEPAPVQDEAAMLARDTQRVQDMNVLTKALQTYYEKFNSYPPLLEVIPKDILENEPKDPLTQKPYEYAPRDNRASYSITVTVEKQMVIDGTTYPAGPIALLPKGATPTEPTPPVEENPVPPTPDASNLDADSDGLTAAEESIFGTSPVNPDTDNDGYRDNIEINNFYSPTQTGAVKLDQAGLVKLFTNEPQKYSFYYPSSWVVNTPDADGVETLITTGTGENFSVTVKDNADGKTSWEWYTQNISHDFNPNSVSIVTIAGHEAVKTLDGLQAYVAISGKVYVIKYNLNTEIVIRYPSVFLLILDHFRTL